MSTAGNPSTAPRAHPALVAGEAPPPPDTPDASEAPDKRSAALQRLAASRALLGLHLIPPPAPALFGAGGTHVPAGSLPQRMAALWRHWRQRARHMPALALAIEAGRGWWQHQTWRASAVQAVQALRAEVAPVVQRHPLAAAGLACGMGLALVWARPWRWPVVSRQMAPVPGRLRHWAAREAAKLPLQAMLSGLLLLWAERRAAESANAEAADRPPAASPAPAQTQATEHLPQAESHTQRS